LCTSTPKYGTGNEAGNEKGYLIGVRQVASDILRRGVELRYYKLFPQLKFYQIINSLNNELLKY